MDHAVRKQDGGTASSDNMQLTHPYYNSGSKESMVTKAVIPNIPLLGRASVGRWPAPQLGRYAATARQQWVFRSEHLRMSQAENDAGLWYADQGHTAVRRFSEFAENNA